MKELRLSKANMLTNNKEFKRECNDLRKLHNDYIKLDVFDDVSIKTLSLAISLYYDDMMIKYGVSFLTICQVIRVTPQTARNITRDYRKLKSPQKPKSYLIDRQHYARLIVDGVKTRQEIAKQTGYHYNTVSSWVTDYKRYGNKMTNQAIAFRREL
jgi:DNA-binding CsgD family transcriptional regulator